MNRLIIIGASGHGKVIADMAIRCGYEDIVFLDDNEMIKECVGFPVIGNVKNVASLEGDKVVAIGNALTRERIQKEINTVSLVHPNAVIGRRVTIGRGTVIMAGAIVNSDTCIGDGCIINTASSIDHDCRVDNYAHIAVGAHLCGTVNVGKSTWIGAGAIVNNNISICDNAIVGSGAVVISDINVQGTYVGVPALKK